MLRYVALRCVTVRSAGRHSSDFKDYASAMSNSAKAEALLALHRFGMGPRPGSIAAIEADPRGALIAELDRPLLLVAAANLPSSAKAYRTVADANAKRAARAKQAQQETKKKAADGRGARHGRGSE
jgi:uncharacterized protein (DUF1800 family)